jgi:hypothetical protein
VRFVQAISTGTRKNKLLLIDGEKKQHARYRKLRIGLLTGVGFQISAKRYRRNV